MNRTPPARPLAPLLALTAALCACGGDPPPPAPVPAEAPSQPALTFEEILGLPAADEPEFFRAGDAWPELAFQAANQGLPTSGTWREEPILHDFTRDGRASIVASNREEDGLNVFEYLPEGTWRLRIDGLRRDLMYGGSAVADFDGDGHDDLLFGSHKTGLVLYLGDGAMGWRPGAEIASPMLMIDVAVGDLNGDGIPDAVGIGQFNGGVEAYLGDGAGNLRHLPESASLEWLGFGMTIALADLDGDGLDDILVASRVGAKALLTRVDEAGKFSWIDRSRGLPAPREGNTMRSVVAADILGDGRLEIVACRVGMPAPDANHFGVFGWNEAEETWEQIDRGVPRDHPYTEALAADFDRDGHLDLILASSFGLVAVYLGDGTGNFTLAGKLPGVTGNRHRAALGDVDGDGWTDVLLLFGASKQDKQGGGLRVFLNRPEIWTAVRAARDSSE